MKKIFTLLLCTTIISAAFAGDGHHGDRDRNFGFVNSPHEEFRQPGFRNWSDRYQPRGGGFFRPGIEVYRPAFHVNFIAYRNNQYALDQRDALIGQITADYNYQVQQVANDYNLSPGEKDYQISNLEAQEQQAINNVYAQCGVPVPMGLRISLGRRYR
jgi:hypothetical protein